LLLEKEALGRQMNYILLPSEIQPKDLPPASSTSIPIQENTKRHQHERQLDHIANSRHHIERISEQADLLRSRIAEHQAERTRRKTVVLERKATLAAATNTLRQQQASQLEPLKKQIKKANLRHDAMYREIISARVYLCREAALLAGLSRKPLMVVAPMSQSSSTVFTRETYTIAGVLIPDLRQLNNASPPQVTHALSSLARLLVLVCYYLSIHLPAELILPHREYPLATILTPASSYVASQTLPSTAGSASANNVNGSAGSTTSAMPPGSNADQTAMSRPRPLYLSKPLQQLSREEPSTYTLFLEGATLLAWDIAWLCRTQGLTLASSQPPSASTAPPGSIPAEWEDISAVGRNISLLLCNPRHDPHPSSARPTMGQRYSSTGSNTPRHGKEIPQQGLGVLSHATAHPRAFLSSGVSPTTLCLPLSSGRPAVVGNGISLAAVLDKVKAFLGAEAKASGNEWEVLDFAYESDASPADTTATGREREGGLKMGGESVPLARNESSDGSAGKSGWMRLRSRGAL